jgi:transposase
MHATTVAVDLAKDVFEIAIATSGGAVATRRRLTRRQFHRFVNALEAGTHVIFEACGTAHYWGRQCHARGAVVRLLPPHYVRPYVRRNKTDRTDAEALLEANRCGGIYPVPVKTPEQQALQSLHRLRTQWQRTRTARINTVRGVLREHGIVVPVGAHRLRAHVIAALETHGTTLPGLVVQMLDWLLDDLRAVDQRLKTVDRDLRQLSQQHPVAARLQEISGVGPLTATALVASVPHIHAFRRGRHFASWLGLTPRESSSGTRRHLGGISKRGDRYLRCLLAHGARAVLQAATVRARARQHLPRLYDWGLRLRERRGQNRAVIGVANKLARIIWAVWSRESAVPVAP